MNGFAMDMLTNPAVLTGIFVGAGVLILLYILKLIRKDEDVVVQKTKYATSSTHFEKRRDAGHHTSKTKKKVVENKWTVRNEKQVFTHPWLLTSLKGHTGTVLDVEFSSNAKYLISCCDEDQDSSSSSASGETSSSSDYNKESSRSPSLEPSPRVKKGLSRRQKKNRRKEVPPSSKMVDQNMPRIIFNVFKRRGSILEQFSLFPGSPEVFEKLLRSFVLSEEKLEKFGYPVEDTSNLKSVKFYRNTRFDVHAREFVPKSEYSDSGQGSSSSSDSGDSVDSEELSEEMERFLKLREINPDMTENIYERTCARCSSIFFTSDETHLTLQKCHYHWGRLRIVSGFGPRHYPQKQYSCCNGLEGFPGCTTAELHVWNGVVPGSNGPFEDYVCTKPTKTPSRTRNGCYGVFAMDCEMCFTTQGLMCTKVTVVDVEGEAVYDSYVIPDHDIVDYNTRFSGVTKEDLASKYAKPMRKVQNDLLQIISERSILIGHGLENDLRSLRIVHKNIVDTAHVFPHAKGLPFKQSLKNLTRTILNKDIQCGGETGHDSNEDARACMELMLWKVHKDYKEYLESRVTATIHI